MAKTVKQDKSPSFAKASSFAKAMEDKSAGKEKALTMPVYDVDAKKTKTLNLPKEIFGE